MHMKFFNHTVISKTPIVALSGGVDSVVLLDFAMKHSTSVTAAHYIHNLSENAEKEYQFVRQLCEQRGIQLIIGKQETEKSKTVSLEAYWRHGRMEFLSALSHDTQVLTGHHLGDAVEWYLFTCLTGEGHYMPFRHQNIIKPLIVTTKAVIVDYAQRYNLTWIEDPTNQDLRRARNRIRHEIIPKALDVSPGLYTVVKRKITEKFSES